MSDLLPPNSTALERRLARAQQHISALPVEIRHVRNPATCPVALLPYLAWELSVDEWNPAWGEDVKRRVIAESMHVHRRKGTRGAMLRALEAIFGEGGFILNEGAVASYRDGSKRRDGQHFHGQIEHWAKYSVQIRNPISRQQAAEIRRILERVAPARCHLTHLDYQAATNRHDGRIRRDGQHNRGVV